MGWSGAVHPTHNCLNKLYITCLGSVHACLPFVSGHKIKASSVNSHINKSYYNYIYDMNVVNICSHLMLKIIC